MGRGNSGNGNVLLIIEDHRLPPPVEDLPDLSRRIPLSGRSRIKRGHASGGLAGPDTRMIYALGEPGPGGLNETAYNVPDIENCRRGR